MNAQRSSIDQSDRSATPSHSTTADGQNVVNKWKTKCLGDHVRFLRHGSYPRIDLTSGGTVGYLHYGDIHTSTRVRLARGARVLPTLPSNRARLLDRLEVGDVVFVDASEDLEGVGKSVEIGELEGREIVSGLHTIAARFDKSVLADGFKAYLQFCPALKGQLRRLAAGTKVYAISRAHIASVCVPLPPVPEQRAIASVLMDVDALIESLEELIAKNQAVKQATMQQLLTGNTRLPGFSGVWETRRIGELAEVDPENLPGNTPPDFSFNYISIEDVHAGRLTGYSKESFQTAPSRARRIVRTGDILMSTVRPALRGHLHFDGRLTEAVCSTGFAVLRSKRDQCDPRFLFAHLFGEAVETQVQALLIGSNYPAINSTNVRGLRVTCPPTLKEQQAIAAILGDLDLKIYELECRLAKTHALKQGLMQQLLTGSIRLLAPDAVATNEPSQRRRSETSAAFNARSRGNAGNCATIFATTR